MSQGIQGVITKIVYLLSHCYGVHMYSVLYLNWQNNTWAQVWQYLDNEYIFLLEYMGKSCMVKSSQDHFSGGFFRVENHAISIERREFDFLLHYITAHGFNLLKT